MGRNWPTHLMAVLVIGYAIGYIQPLWLAVVLAVGFGTIYGWLLAMRRIRERRDKAERESWRREYIRRGGRGNGGGNGVD